MKTNTLAFTAALFLLLGVVLGAFGAHALRDILTDGKADTWHTATEYLFVHALGALILLQFQQYQIQRLLRISAFFLLLGALLFSGSLYILCLEPGWKILGPMTPVGGTAFIVGWLIAAIAMYKLNKE